MSALVAAALQKAALKGLNRIGGDVTISYVSAGDYDVTTGTVPDFSTTVETHEVKGVLQDVNAREVNELIQAGDKRLEVPAVELPTAPQTKDRVTVVGVEHQVVRVKTIEQANTPITYVLYLRV
ncbi:putative tail protein [uncultured Mediterranean phage uvMED]|nr:putative tail protein [uncultured Mediterranean phage uvMED]BAQ93606.1 putative tail protein [uncultured Mediterranean phage uvMED]BAR24990.1 putative tail protein [uncultured Mediterranean phage uvMED]BAR25072.1 putative tail protein [uncultured Mediterranean phage uvMED]BAR25083.1 putative tail protein [uncultured Mediterranean phage uvMED]